MSCCGGNVVSKGKWIAGFAVAGLIGAFAGSRLISRPANAVDAPASSSTESVHAKSPIDAGRYLIKVGGCNDCHTPGSMQGLQVPEEQWLTGVPLGWYGPWGTTYASNLRLLVADMPEEVWVKMLHERHERPPMPWSAVNAMSDSDAKALYAYIKSLGKRGEKMPEPLPPGQEPKTPYLSMIPNTPATPKGK